MLGGSFSKKKLIGIFEEQIDEFLRNNPQFITSKKVSAPKPKKASIVRKMQKNEIVEVNDDYSGYGWI